MKAFQLTSFNETALQDVPDPEPSDAEVLVRVRASSANPVDNAIAAGMLDGMVEHDFPVTLGRDYAGVVERVGSGVSAYAEGDEVYGFLTHANPTVHDGSWAELIVLDEDGPLAASPAGVEAAAAGVAPLAGITAMAAVDALGLSAGDTVLIVGATGGVGSFAVQLAVTAGAQVLAPGLAEDEDYLSKLGVTQVLDREGDLVGAVRETHPDGVDGLIDLVSYGPDEFEANAAALRPDGRGSSPLSAAGDGPGRANVGAAPTAENLERLGALLGDGTLKVRIQRSYSLEHAGEALQDLAGKHTQGKLAIEVA